MIGIIDYGRGNLRSVEKAFHYLGMDAKATSNLNILKRAKGLILPGVGAFDDAMRELRRMGLDSFIVERIGEGLPFMGICLGYQMLFERSEEGGEQPGLGILPGTVRRLPSNGLKVPHMGWNSIHIKKESSLINHESEGGFFYFVHSYYVDPDEDGLALTETEYGVNFASGIEKDNLYGFQFHPEKSSQAGLAILLAFGREAGEDAA